VEVQSQEEMRAEPEATLNADALLAVWPALSHTEQSEAFQRLPRNEAEDLFLALGAADQAVILHEISPADKRSWVRLLAPDDAADLVQELSPEERSWVLALLDDTSRREVTALLAYAEDEAGGLMSSRFIRLRPDMGVDEAITYLRQQAKGQVETIYYAYVLDSEQKLLGVASLRQIFTAAPDRRVRDIMETDLKVIPEDMDQEEVSRIFSQNDLTAMPVVDAEGRMKGIVTVDDIVTVVQEEATEDFQKMGGTEALDAPYFQISFLEMIKKRAGWLTVLFVGEMFTATAMGFFSKEIERAVVLALFIPLIISSGGNSGSQATTLIIRAMALGEVRIKDWWRVLARECASGLALGAILGSIGLLRIIFWPSRHTLYGDHYALIAAAVATSLVGVVLWGTLAGSMLPFLLRRLGFDPASASAPFVATIVDVTGLVIYFSVASLILGGTVL
jgi:magnesium transporter